MLDIRIYVPSNYSQLKALYDEAGRFDPETDAEKRLNTPSNTILLAYKGSELVGTVSLLNTGRHALFFRLITKPGGEENEIRRRLLESGEKKFLEMGFEESHILALGDDSKIQEKYEEYGFKKGKQYRWFWKKI